jgi:hypothetical protein
MVKYLLPFRKIPLEENVCNPLQIGTFPLLLGSSIKMLFLLLLAFVVFFTARIKEESMRRN